MAARTPAVSARSPARAAHRLARYWSKRDFSKTAEPRGERLASGKALSFVIQKHAASRLHYDFRLELDGVLVSWAVPKGPSIDPADKRLAVHVEDHPISYGTFEGTIPPRQYGAGTVVVWDRGSWEPIGDPHKGLKQGKLAFRLRGEKLKGLWELVRIAKGGERQDPWLLFKKRDEFARPKAAYDVVSAMPDSVIAKPADPGKATTPARPARPAKPARHALGAPSGRTGFPTKLAPQLATLASSIPTTGEWVFEIKFDGYRIMARVDQGKVGLLTRGGHDWARKLPHLVSELRQLRLASSWLDGEIVVLDANDRPDFSALQKAFDGRADVPQVLYFLFDLPFFEGRDLRDMPLVARRQLLQELLAQHETAHLRFSANVAGDAASVLRSACSMQLEGLIAKRADAPYVSRRTDSWLKLKCKQRQEFVLCGYVERSDNRAQVGSLLLGVHDAQGGLRPVGRVGTGWSSAEARALRSKLKKLEITKAPYQAEVARRRRWLRPAAAAVHWVRPQLVAEVEFAQWTPDQQVRHAAFVALRSDKPARAIVREVPSGPPGPESPPARKQAAVAGVKVTHGERVIDSSTGLTKLDLVRYYESIAPWMLPQLQERPCSLLRAPAGVAGQQFFQKHAERGLAGIKRLPASLWPGHDALLEITTAQALASAAQMNVIEFHTWNSITKRIDTPDRMIFDLDPGAGTKWQQIQEAATLTRALLRELGLECWLKTSGGKGLHLVVPLAARWSDDVVKGLSRAIVQHLAKTIPARFVAQSGASNRLGKLFVDYLRNGHGATTVAAFSARARPGLGVSMPIAWEQLPELQGAAHWTISNAPAYLAARKHDPWADYGQRRQSLAQAMKTLAFSAKPRRP